MTEFRSNPLTRRNELSLPYKKVEPGGEAKSSYGKAVCDILIVSNSPGCLLSWSSVKLTHVFASGPNGLVVAAVDVPQSRSLGGGFTVPCLKTDDGHVAGLTLCATVSVACREAPWFDTPFNHYTWCGGGDHAATLEAIGRFLRLEKPSNSKPLYYEYDKAFTELVDGIIQTHRWDESQSIVLNRWSRAVLIKNALAHVADDLAVGQTIREIAETHLGFRDNNPHGLDLRGPKRPMFASGFPEQPPSWKKVGCSQTEEVIIQYTD